MAPWPWHVRAILAQEAGERFAYYASRALLVLYFTERLGFSDGDAIALYSAYISLAYGTPLLGGYVADVYAGRYRAIVSFSITYVVGLLVLGCTAFVGSTPGAAFGLLLMATGSGGVKANVGAFGAEQLADFASDEAASTFWLLWYAAVNGGSVFSYVVTPLIRVHAGYGPAFLTAAGVLALSVAVFLAPSRWYAMRPPAGVSVYASVARVVGAGLCRAAPGGLAAAAAAAGAASRAGSSGESTPLMSAPPPALAVAASSERAEGRGSGESDGKLLLPAAVMVVAATPSPQLRGRCGCCSPAGMLDAARARGVPADEVNAVAAFFAIVPLFACLPAFWMLFDSQDSVWTLQRKQMDLCLWPSACLTPEQFGALNPILCLAFVPLMDRCVLPALRATRLPWAQPTALRRMTVGMQVAALSFVLTALVQRAIDAAPEGSRVNVAWQLPQIVVITAAEILVSATGLEFAYSAAPPTMRGTIMALYFLTTAVGDAVAGVLYSALSEVLSPLQLAVLLAALMAVSGAAFAALAARYTPRPRDEAPKAAT